MTRAPRFAAWLLTIGVVGCASVPPVAPTPSAPVAPVVPLDRKAAWILRLEQQRVLRDPAVGADLIALAHDADVGVRRRAVLAIGRVRSPEGVPAALESLGHPDEAVRAAAAFALGLLGDRQALPALEAALTDPSPLVRGRAAQGLGLIGAAEAAPFVASAAAGCPALMVAIPADDEERQTPEVEACRSSIVALVRLRQFDAIAAVVLDARGQPVSRWWPIAFALQRSGDARAAEPLAALAKGEGVYSRAYALRGLSSLKDSRTVPLSVGIALDPAADVRLRAEAVRAIGRAGGTAAVPSLMKLLGDRATPTNLALDVVTALGQIADPQALPLMIDLFAASSPAIRAAAMTAAARMDADGFLLTVSSLEPDPDWSVRANLATVLATLPADRVRAAVQGLADDRDARVQGPALRALARVDGPDVDRRILDALQAPDFVLRATAASLVGERRPPAGASRLGAAYARGESDATYVARAAALEALGKYPLTESTDTLTRALADPDWPVRLVAAKVLRQAGVTDASPVRPAPLRQPPAFFESDRLLHPVYTPHAYIETQLGTIQVELNMIDAPVTTLTFVELARAGFFNGLKIHRLIPNFVLQAGDPRGDGEGGPGYDLRDELSPVPFVRGTLGMALDGPDTGGSQFFITLSPQPHLDGQYTVFGRVVRGWSVLDQVSMWDVIERVWIWDGSER